MICQINGALTFFVYYFNFFFLRLIITCRLWVIYVREDNYSNVQVMIKRLIWTIWTPMSSVLKKADKLNLSLSPGPVKLPSDECHRSEPMMKSTLVQVMAWCHEAPSHYLDQCWPSPVTVWHQQCPINEHYHIHSVSVMIHSTLLRCVHSAGLAFFMVHRLTPGYPLPLCWLIGYRASSPAALYMASARPVLMENAWMEKIGWLCMRRTHICWFLTFTVTVLVHLIVWCKYACAIKIHLCDKSTFVW